MTANPLPKLQPADCLLYRPKGVIGWIIAIKTWHRIAHVEVFDGNGTSLASRDGIGVGRYPFRRAELCRVLRPLPFPNMKTGRDWFERCARGQKYDWKALFRFIWPGYNDPDFDRQICSAFAVRFYRECGLQLFADGEDADRIAPAAFMLSPWLAEIWSDGKPV